MSGSVRGLIATLGLLPHQKVGYGLYSTEKRLISALSVCSVVDYPCLFSVIPIAG